MRISRTLGRVAVPAGLAAASCLVATAPAQADAPDNGCPPTYELLTVSVLTAAGYGIPAALDDPNGPFLSFGSPGNGDNTVCALPLGNRTTPEGLQIYNFWDNTLVAE